MNTNNENTPQPGRDVMHNVSTNNNVSTTPQHATTITAVKRGLLQGMAIALGFFGTTILGVAISGTIKTWASGEVLKSADLNATISNMKTAIESIPNWTKNGTDAYYTDGKVGIGTASPGYPLQISGDLSISNNGTLRFGSAGAVGFTSGTNVLSIGGGVTGRVVMCNGNASSCDTGINVINSGGANFVGIGTTTPSANLQVVGTTLAAAWSTSDERYKKNIQNIPNPTEKILKLRGVNYEWRREEYKDLKFKAGQDFGFIGQEVEKVLPETIFKDEKGYLYVSYQTILPVLVEAFKEQKSLYDKEKSSNDKRISLLEDSNKKLKTDNEKLLKELTELSSRYAVLLDDRDSLKKETGSLKASVEMHGRASLRMEERLNALEKATAAQAAGAVQIATGRK